jgi:hypothetical protein
MLPGAPGGISEVVIKRANEPSPQPYSYPDFMPDSSLGEVKVERWGAYFVFSAGAPVQPI